MLIDQLRNACVLEELGQAIDDRVVRPLRVTDRREVGMVRVQLADKASEKRLLRLAREAIVGNEDMDSTP